MFICLYAQRLARELKLSPKEQALYCWEPTMENIRVGIQRGCMPKRYAPIFCFTDGFQPAPPVTAAPTQPQHSGTAASSASQAPASAKPTPLGNSTGNASDRVLRWWWWNPEPKVEGEAEDQNGRPLERHIVEKWPEFLSPALGHASGPGGVVSIQISSQEQQIQTANMAQAGTWTENL